jgi:hypothetical protein
LLADSQHSLRRCGAHICSEKAGDLGILGVYPARVVMNLDWPVRKFVADAERL